MFHRNNDSPMFLHWLSEVHVYRLTKYPLYKSLSLVIMRMMSFYPIHYTNYTPFFANSCLTSCMAYHNTKCQMIFTIRLYLFIFFRASSNSTTTTSTSGLTSNLVITGRAKLNTIRGQ